MTTALRTAAPTVSNRPGSDLGATGKDECGEEERACYRDGAEPVGGPKVPGLRDQPGDGIAETDTDGGGDREGGDRPAGLVRRQVPPRDGHGHGEDAETDTLKAAADEELGEVVRDGGHDAAGDDTGQGEQDHVSLPGPVGQPAHDRGHECTDQQRDREQPFARAQGDTVSLGQRRE